MKMKLNLFFIVMDLLTILAYPIVFAHGKLHQLAKSKEGVALVLAPTPVTPGRRPIEKL
jgi:hypothetical protein